MPVSQKTANPDAAGFGVYVHWPFCAAKCPYCDFNSHVRHGGIDQAAFIAGYRCEIAHLRDLTGPRSVRSIFFGGGTPSLRLPATVEALLEAIQQAWQVEAGAEVTLEANPSSVEAQRFKAYRTAGINRLSLGVQALADADLQALGRLHTAQQALAGLDVAANTFERFSFDLIYARPGQTLTDWRRELTHALSLGSQHLSVYQLTIEDGTPFAARHRAGKLHIPEPELADDFYELTQDMTAAAGMPAYEISNHAVPGQESQHNLLYWRYGEYAGIGPGAHGRLIVDDCRIATSSERVPETWLDRVAGNGHGFVEFEKLNAQQQADELLLMGLRIAEGVDLERLARVGGVKPGPPKVAELIAQGLLTSVRDGNGLRAAGRGRFILNRLVLELATSFEVV